MPFGKILMQFCHTAQCFIGLLRMRRMVPRFRGQSGLGFVVLPCQIFVRFGVGFMLHRVRRIVRGEFEMLLGILKVCRLGPQCRKAHSGGQDRPYQVTNEQFS